MANSGAVGHPALEDSRSVTLGEWRRGWPVVVAGVFGCILLALGEMSSGAFMAPMQAEFGWSRSIYSLGFSVHTIPGFFLPALIGILIDRVGLKVLAVFGSLFSGTAFCLYATVTGTVTNWVALSIFHGMANQFIFATLWYSAVATRFTSSRGLAIAIVMSGSAVSGVIAPLMANFLISEYGFRTTFVAMGAFWGTVVASISLFGMPRRASRPVNAAMEAERKAEAASLPGLTVRQGVRSSAFYKFMILIFISYAVLLGLTLHLIPLLSGVGFSRNLAVMLASSFGFAIIVGKITAGLAVDRLPARYIGVLFNATLAISAIMLTVPSPSIAWASTAVLLLGLSYGGIAPTYPYLVSRYLGTKSFGRLFGMLACFYSISAAFGPLAAGYIHDVTNSYTQFLLGSLPALFIACVLCFSLGRYPDFEKSAA